MNPVIRSKSARVSVLLGSISLLAHSASGSTMLDPSDGISVVDADYINRATSFASVGEIFGSGFGGSGVLIDSQWVLTAGHVAALKGTGGTFSINGTVYSVSQSITHPDWGFGSDLNDIGLLQLSTAVVGIAPAPIYAFADDSYLLGQTVDWVGFGQGGTGLTGASGATGTARAFTNVIDTFGPDFGLAESSFFSDFDRPDGSENSNVDFGSDPLPSIFEGNVAPGDSGGGVFLEEFGLVGIISYRGALDGTQNSDYGDISGGTRLSLYEDWIFEQSGVAAVPEPNASAVISIALLGVIILRRRI